jgi:hypothetical protein
VRCGLAVDQPSELLDEGPDGDEITGSNVDRGAHGVHGMSRGDKCVNHVVDVCPVDLPCALLSKGCSPRSKQWVTRTSLVMSCGAVRRP